MEHLESAGLASIPTLGQLLPGMPVTAPMDGMGILMAWMVEAAEATEATEAMAAVTWVALMLPVISGAGKMYRFSILARAAWAEDLTAAAVTAVVAEEETAAANR